jgi:hypothetical protein
VRSGERYSLHVLRSVAAVLALSFAAPARADDAPVSHRVSLELELDDCLGARAASVRRIVAAEVGDALIGGEDGTAAGDAETSTRARAECGVETVVVAVSHPGTRVRLERRVDLTSVGETARARLLALSIVELVASAWSAVDALPPEPAEPEVVETPAPVEERDVLPRIVRRDPVEREHPRERRPFGIRAIGVARVSGSPFHLSGGGGLGLEAALPFGLGVGGDARYEQGAVTVDQLGDVTLRVAWSTLSLLFRPVVGSNALTVAVGAKLGLAWLEGSPRPGVGGATQVGFVAGPSVASYASFSIAGSGYFHLGLELDWVLAGVAGENSLTGEEVVRFGGPSLAITAGFEIQPGR